MFAVFASVQDQSYNKGVFITYPVGGGGGGHGKIMRGTETFEVLPLGEGFGGIVTVST